MSTPAPRSGRGLDRRMFLRRAGGSGLLIPLSGGAVAFLASACGGGDSESAQPVETAGGAAETGQEMVPGSYTTALGFSLSFVEVMIAKEQGYFEEEGLDLEIQGGQGTATALQAVLGGSVDIGRANAINTTIAIANEDAPITNIGTARQQGQFEVVSLPESPVETPAALEGTRCGIVSAGGATENLLDLLLVQEGIPVDSVARPVTGVGSAAYELARGGEIDAWISVDTDRATIEETGGIDLVVFNTDEYLTIPSDSYNVTQEMVDSGSDLPVRFLAGVLRAIDFARDEANWEQVVEALRVYNPEADPEQTLFEIPLLIESWTARGDENILALLPEVWESGQELLAEAGLINQTVELDRLIYTDYLEQARGRVS